MKKGLNYFKENGYFVARKLLNPSEVEYTLKSLTKTISTQVINFNLKADSDYHQVLRSLYVNDLERYKKIVGALWRKNDVLKLLSHENIINFLENKFNFSDIFQPGGQVVHIIAHDLAIPGGYFGIDSHQDYLSVQGSLDGVVVWMPLVDVDKNNFPLEIIPKSHRAGILPLNDLSFNDQTINNQSIKVEDYITLEVEPGDVIFMSVFTVHRTSIYNNNSRCRISLSTRYDNGIEKTYIERGFPSAYLRSVHRKPLIENFPSPDDLYAIFRPDL